MHQFTAVTMHPSTGPAFRTPATVSTTAAGHMPTTAPAPLGSSFFAPAVSDVIEGIRRQQEKSLAAAIAAGPAALLQYADREQKKRNKSAREEWTTYRLYKPEGCTYAQGVISPEGLKYRVEVTEEGTKRFPTCPAQEHIDNVNAALRGAGLTFRLESKHALIMHLRERHAWANGLTWSEPGQVEN